MNCVWVETIFFYFYRNNSMKQLFFSIFFTFLICASNAQNLDIPSVFKSGVRLGGIYMPEIRVNDSVSYGMSRVRMTVIIPIKGNVKLDLKNQNIMAHQSFISLNAGLRNTIFSPVPDANNIYNAVLGFTHIRASIKNGFWLFHGRVLYDYDLKNPDNDILSALGGVAKIYIKSINKINIYGIGFTYSKRVIPIPIFGIRRTLTDNLSLTAIFPLEADLSYRLSDKFDIEFKNTISALKTGFLVDTTKASPFNYKNDNVLLSNYNYLSTLLLIYKPRSNVQIYVEGGVYPFMQLRLTESDGKTRIVKPYNYFFAPYASVTIRYSFGDFLFGSQLFGTDE